MQVVMYAPYGYRTPHFEIELEVIQRHLDAGDCVTVLTCDAELPACEVNPEHRRGTCLRCIWSRQAGLNLLSQGVATASLIQLTTENRAELATIPPTFDGIRQLKSFRMGTFDAGYSVLSSIVCMVRDPDVDLIQHAALVSRLLWTACAVYRSMLNYLTSHQVDRLYVFNAREAPTRGVLRACQELGVECHVLEIGGDFQKYNVYVNTLPHDRTYVENLIQETWRRAADDPDRFAIGSQWFEERPRGIDRVWKSCVAQQSVGKLPQHFDPSKRNIVIFPSSEDEFVAVGDEWNYPFYSSQVAGLQAIIDSLASDPRDLHLYLRIHPNLAGVENARKRELESLASPFLTIIPAEDPISSYALLRAANKILTFGSTLGIEAVYWGVPSVLAQFSYFYSLEATYNPRNHEELVAMLYADLKPRDRELAVMYGYYFATLGTPFQYYEPENLVRGKFKGERIQPNSLQRMVVRFHRVVHSIRKRLPGQQVEPRAA